MCQKCHIITRYEPDAADGRTGREPRMYSASDRRWHGGRISLGRRGIEEKSELTRDAEKMKVFRGVGFVGGLGCWMAFFLLHEVG